MDDRHEKAMACPNCKGTGTEPDWVGLEMRCVEVECSRCKGTGRAALPEPARAGEAVAWRVKDYADGWIFFAREGHARSLAEKVGALIEPLFVAPAPTVSAGVDDAEALRAKLAEAEREIDRWQATAVQQTDFKVAANKRAAAAESRATALAAALEATLPYLSDHAKRLLGDPKADNTQVITAFEAARAARSALRDKT